MSEEKLAEDQRQWDLDIGKTDFPVGSVVRLRAGGALLTVTGHDMRGPVVALANEHSLSQICVSRHALERVEEVQQLGGHPMLSP